MTFSYTLGTTVGDLRLRIFDTDVNNVIFTDEEITNIYNGVDQDLNQAVGTLLLTIANSNARLAISKRAGNYSEDTKSIAKELREQAKAWFERALEPYDDVAEQTFGPVINPYTGRGEQEFIARDNLRNDS